ncbi:MAG: hypothetical protein V2A77_11455, partial [Pseudomonadota bacterium]
VQYQIKPARGYGGPLVGEKLCERHIKTIPLQPAIATEKNMAVSTSPWQIGKAWTARGCLGRTWKLNCGLKAATATASSCRH